MLQRNFHSAKSAAEDCHRKRWERLLLFFHSIVTVTTSAMNTTCTIK